MRKTIVVLAGLTACGGQIAPAPSGDGADGAGGQNAAADVPGIDRGWEKDCVSATCGLADKPYVRCSDPNYATHYHFAGKSCQCPDQTRCVGCDPNASCQCALDATAWCESK
jgi:hypothetical protein